MPQLLVPLMGKSNRGRPRKDDDEGTKMVRLHADLAEMISWIVKLDDGVSAALVVDPLLRPQILARYERIRPQVEKIKRAQDEAKKGKPAAGPR